jgi:hypothetical protein
MREEEERKAYTLLLDEFEDSFGAIFCGEYKEYIEHELLPLIREVARTRVLMQLSEVIIDENETNPTLEKRWFAQKLIHEIIRLLDEPEIVLKRDDDSDNDDSDELPLCHKCYIRHKPREEQ